jgi:hypothetical protein
MSRRITTVSAREMPCPKEVARTAIWEIKNIEHTEVKADAVDVTPADPMRGSYKVRGHFAGVPWRGEFDYELNEGGFHSRNAGVPPEQATIEGGFIVTPTADGCTVIHYEQYVLPAALVPIKWLIRAYLRWSMRRELGDLERLLTTRRSTPARHRAVDQVAHSS